MKKKDKLLAQFQIKDKNYSVRATIHALDRMKTRKVDEYIVTGMIIGLGEERLSMIVQDNEEAMIIDQNENIAIVLAARGYKIKVVTVLDRGRVWVKKGTRVEIV